MKSKWSKPNQNRTTLSLTTFFYRRSLLSGILSPSATSSSSRTSTSTTTTTSSQIHREMMVRRQEQLLRDELTERVWQRHAAIWVVLFLFVAILLVVMVIIYGGIQPDGLVLSIHTVTIDTSKRNRSTVLPGVTTLRPTFPPRLDIDIVHFLFTLFWISRAFSLLRVARQKCGKFKIVLTKNVQYQNSNLFFALDLP